MKYSSTEQTKTNQLINGETVAFCFAATVCVFIFTAVKQILKVFIGLNASASVLAAFVIAEALLYLFEKRFVFHKNILSSNVKQIIMLIFRSAVNFGFYKLSEFLFGNILDMENSFVWFIAIASSVGFNYFFDRILLFDCNYEAQSVKKSRIYKAFYFNRYIFLSGVFAAFCISVIYILYSAFPFGDYTVMRMDLYHQYGPLFAELYDRVVNHQSFFYSWNSGGGSSFLGNYFNYLSSPLSALIFLFDKKDIANAITFLVSVKCILSSASFTFYLSRSQKKHNYLTAALGVFYAFSAYMLAYYWNVMWLDAMILLPLIALGIENIINGKSIGLYCASLVLLFFSSYYMGFMCCIFAVIYFIFYYAISSKLSEKINPQLTFTKKNRYSLKAIYNNKLVNNGVRFAFGSILAACVCAVTLIPVFIILRSSSATSDTFPTNFEAYFDIFDFLTSHLAGLETTIRSSGEDVLPNIYSGILAVILLPLFVINKRINLKEKAAYILVLLLLLFSFNNNCMNFIWHAFHFPNDLPFRFSYMYSFLILTAGCKCLSKLDGINTKDICYVGILWLFFIILVQKSPTTKIDALSIYSSIAFVILWCGFLYVLRQKKVKKLISCVMCLLLVFAEVVICDTRSFHISYENEDYSSSYDSTVSALEKLKEYDDGFYREELCYLETRMDPCYYGYKGMSVFSSMAYEDYSQLQYSLGMFGNRINSYTYNTQTPIYNLMFGIKYLLYSGTGSKPDETLYGYCLSSDDGDTDVYENNYFLPIAYAVNSSIDDWNTEEGNPFEVQGDFFRLATGYSGIFNEINYISTEFDGLTGDTVTENGTYWVEDEQTADDYGYVYITVSPKTDGNLYLYVTSPDIKSIDVENTLRTPVNQSIEEPYILDLGYYSASEEAVITIDCSTLETDSAYFDIFAYSLNQETLDLGYQKLNNNSLEITKSSDTAFEGTITVDEDSYLYSSIPYDKGWKIEIDGTESETFTIGGSMLGTVIKAGEHTVKYSYSPRGFIYGAIISGASILGICGYFVYSRKRKKDIDLTEKTTAN